MKRALVETAAVAGCVLLGVLAGRAYDPAIPWAVYLGLVFGAAALLLVVGVRIEKRYESKTTTGRSSEAARVQDPYEEQTRGVDC